MEHQNSGNGLHLGSAIVGLAAGIVGTILYATYKEREFNRVVGKTRELGDRSSEYLSDVTENVRSKAVTVVDNAQQTVDRLSEKVKSAVAPKGESTSALPPDVASTSSYQS
jgi:hypothetical protein